MLCASFVARSSTGKYFVQALLQEVVLGSALCKLCSTKGVVKIVPCKCVASVSQACVCYSSVRFMFFLYKRFRSNSKSFLACRRANMSWDELFQCSDEMKTVEKNLMGWDEKSWDEVTWGENSSNDLRWDEVWTVKCKCEAWSAGCEECRVKCEESVRLASLQCGRAQVLFLDSSAQFRTMHTGTGLARARRMQVLSIDEKGLIVKSKATSALASCGHYWYIIITNHCSPTLTWINGLLIQEPWFITTMGLWHLVPPGFPSGSAAEAFRKSCRTSPRPGSHHGFHLQIQPWDQGI